ncbi:MAG: PhoH family protein [Spirochaetota bacterium]|jgi:phosphate starvation-inducible PhoH-like protein|nr:PhoH family protein [Spirochaetota bacterium]
MDAPGIDLRVLHERRQRLLETELGVSFQQKADTLRVYGAAHVLPLAEKMIRFVLHSGGRLEDAELRHYLAQLRRDPDMQPDVFFEASIPVTRQGRVVRARGSGQLAYLAALRKNAVVFGVGIAGTGKTYMAAAWALHSLLRGAVSRIILVRPVVEAGESLGFLPGDLSEKIDPYLRPLQDALMDILGQDEYPALFENRVIELSPLAYMRGRTLNNAVVILDEAQNTTIAQMKMFLTRIGKNAQAIITGDVTQIDLPHRSQSGLVHALSILRGIDDLEFVFFSEADIVRHPLVRKIIAAYENDAGAAR